MFIDSPLAWSGVALLSIIVVVIESALLFRILWLTHQAWWKYVFLLVPLAISYWSFRAIESALKVYRFLLSLPRVSPALYLHLKTLFEHATVLCQIQVGILCCVFVLLLIVEKRTLPRVRRAPVWVLRKSSLLY